MGNFLWPKIVYTIFKLKNTLLEYSIGDKIGSQSSWKLNFWNNYIPFDTPELWHWAVQTSVSFNAQMNEWMINGCVIVPL